MIDTTVPPPVQVQVQPATIVIGPNTVRQPSHQKRAQANQRRRPEGQGGQEADSQYDDEDDEDDYEEEDFIGMMQEAGGFYGGDDFYPPTTWDLIVKNATPKLPQLDILLHKYQG